MGTHSNINDDLKNVKDIKISVIIPVRNQGEKNRKMPYGNFSTNLETL